MAEEKVLEVKNLHVNFHTYAGDVKAIRDVSFDLVYFKLWNAFHVKDY